MTSFNLLAAQGGIGDMAAGVAETFGLNWWLFLSQCISFSIVAFLLGKFAYQPVLKVLEERRNKIEEGLRNAEQTRVQLAEAQKAAGEIMAKANGDAQKMIEEARAAAKALQEREAQAAIATAEQIVVKAREATEIERAKAFADLKKELARLIIDTTAKVSGKVLTADDQRRLSEEASRELAA